LGIIGVDSSGIVNDPPICMAAVRLKPKQKHRILYMSKNKHEEYKNKMYDGKKQNDEWRLKLSSALIFKSIENLIKQNDIIQIDTDFAGDRKKRVTHYIKKLFGNYYQGTPLENPEIQFVPPMHSDYVKEADRKSKLARHKKIHKVNCPDLWDCIELLD